MKKTYLVLAAVGFAVPNYFSLAESFDSGNWLLIADLSATAAPLFANHISRAFTTDLLLAVVAFLIWTIFDSRQRGKTTPWWLWIVTGLFGIAGSFPLYLYLRQQVEKD